MKKLGKILKVLLAGIILFWSKAVYATTSQEMALKQIGGIKYICIGAGVILILLVLWISYKSDRNHENEDNQLPEEEEEEEEDLGTEEESLYSSFEKNQEEDFLEDIDTSYEKRTNTSQDFQLDAIFDDEEIPDLSYNEIEPTKEIETSEFDTFTQESTSDVSLEDDFLMQMNKNLASETLEDVEDFELEDIEIKAPKRTRRTIKEKSEEMTKPKRTTKKVAEEEPVKKTTTRTRKVAKTEEPEEKVVKKTTTKKTTTKKEEEPVKKTTTRTKKVTKTEEPEEKVAKKTVAKRTTTKKEAEEEEPVKKNTRTTKKITKEEPDKTTTKKTTRKKKEE